MKNKWTGASNGYVRLLPRRVTGGRRSLASARLQDESKWYGPDRKLFLPGGFLSADEVPEYLDGTLAGECVSRRRNIRAALAPGLGAGFFAQPPAPRCALAHPRVEHARRRGGRRPQLVEQPYLARGAAAGGDLLLLSRTRWVARLQLRSTLAEPQSFAPPRAGRPCQPPSAPSRSLGRLLTPSLSYGYDPLGLGKDGNVEKYREFELIHARWAMLGAFGALLPEVIDSFGGNIPGAVWWQTGSVQQADNFTGSLTYLGGIPTLPLPANLAVTVAAFFFLERFRADGGEQPNMPAIFPNGVDGGDKLYPGGSFDPLGLASDPIAFEELKVKEIKNGRLAMVSMLAFAAQAAVTHEGPFANIRSHLSSPFSHNLFTVIGGVRSATL